MGGRERKEGRIDGQRCREREEEAEVNKLPGSKDRWMQLLQHHMCKQYEGGKSGGPKKNNTKCILDLGGFRMMKNMRRVLF